MLSERSVAATSTLSRSVLQSHPAPTLQLPQLIAPDTSVPGPSPAHRAEIVGSSFWKVAQPLLIFLL